MTGFIQPASRYAACYTVCLALDYCPQWNQQYCLLGVHPAGCHNRLAALHPSLLLESLSAELTLYCLFTTAGLCMTTQASLGVCPSTGTPRQRGSNWLLGPSQQMGPPRCHSVAHVSVATVRTKPAPSVTEHPPSHLSVQ